ncbi:MAG: hypothetical protein R3193_16040, partial [Marinobacter sp.]|nr:hypothetical protein [Marinobacter sp.]
MRYLLLINCLALTFLSLTVFAQTSPQAQSVIESRAGSATQTTVMTASALVVGIEKATRTLMLELSSGEVVEVVADDRVRNFDQISLGDELVVEYMQSISLNLQKVRSDDRDISVGAAAARAEPGERPAGAAGQVIQALADVVAVSPEKSTITLRGPLGR